MCCTSLHLLIGVLLGLNVVGENEAMTRNISMEHNFKNSTTMNGTSMDFTNNFNSTSNFQNFTDALPSTTINNTTPPESDFSTSSHEHHPQTSNVTTEDSYMSVTKTTTQKTTTQKTSTTSQTPPEPEPSKNYGSASVIILILIILCIVGITIYFCLQKNSREDAQIPLSTVDNEVFDSTSVKDNKTFSPVESRMTIKDPEPVNEAEKPEVQKAADVKQENPENLSDAQAIVVSKDKAGELTIVDLTDEEMAISTKTSMESLDEPLNENNNNNRTVKATDNGHEFTEISLDLP